MKPIDQLYWLMHYVMLSSPKIVDEAFLMLILKICELIKDYSNKGNQNNIFFEDDSGSQFSVLSSQCINLIFHTLNIESKKFCKPVEKSENGRIFGH